MIPELNMDKNIVYYKIFVLFFFTDFVREKITDTENSVDRLYSTVFAKRILIGTHQFIPTEKVCFSSKGIRIIAPNVKRSEENVILDIQKKEVAKIVAHFQNPKCLLFIYTMNSCGAYIRESLEMGSIHDNCNYYNTHYLFVSFLNKLFFIPSLLAVPYYNPTAKTEYYKRIVLIIDNIPEEAKSVIRSIYVASVLEEISQRDATEMLERCIVKDHHKAITRSDTRYFNIIYFECCTFINLKKYLFCIVILLKKNQRKILDRY